MILVLLLNSILILYIYGNMKCRHLFVCDFFVFPLSRKEVREPASSGFRAKTNVIDEVIIMGRTVLLLETRLNVT